MIPQVRKLPVFLLLFFIVLNVGLWKAVTFFRSEVANSKISSPFIPKIKLKTQCPDETGGNPDALLTFKYFYSPVCPWCLIEDQNLDELLKTRGKLFYFEKYSREKCSDLVKKYKFSIVPSFVFSTKNSSQEFTHEGYISKENFEKIICRVSNLC